jgi:uncharacterized protein
MILKNQKIASRWASIILLLMIIINSSCARQNTTYSGQPVFINYQAIKEFPLPTQPVNDFESLLSDQEIHHLDSLITAYRKQTSSEIAIVTIKDIHPYKSLKDFSTDLGNHWGVGTAGNNNGLIITVSSNLRSIWIGTGVGTQKTLTDEIIQSIIDTEVIPHFKEGDYFNGIKSALTACIKNW